MNEIALLITRHIRAIATSLIDQGIELNWAISLLQLLLLLLTEVLGNLGQNESACEVL